MDFKSLYTGRKVYIKGTNSALATSNEFISSQSLVFSDSGSTNLNASIGAGVICAVASASANDTAEGTGLRTLVVVGAEGTTGKVISETVTMNGQTTVNTVNKYQMIYCIYGATFGSGGKNAGNIDIALKADPTNTSGVLTAPTPALRMLAGTNYESGTMFMIPPNERYTLKKIVYGVSTQPVVLSVYIYTDSAWYLYATIPLGNVTGAELEDIANVTLEAGDIIRIDALSTTAASRVYVNAILEKGVYTG